MAPGAAVTYTCVQPNIQSDFTNVTAATGTPPTGRDVTASDMAPVRTATIKPAPKPKPKPVVHKKRKPKMVTHKKPKMTGLTDMNQGRVQRRRRWHSAATVFRP